MEDDREKRLERIESNRYGIQSTHTACRPHNVRVLFVRFLWFRFQSSHSEMTGRKTLCSVSLSSLIFSLCLALSNCFTTIEERHLKLERVRER
jgi:hypothetical protein